MKTVLIVFVLINAAFAFLNFGGMLLWDWGWPHAFSGSASTLAAIFIGVIATKS